MQIVPFEKPVEVWMRGAFAAIVNINVVNSERWDIWLRLAMVAHKLFQNWGDLRHIQQVTVAASPVQSIATHSAWAAL